MSFRHPSPCRTEPHGLKCRLPFQRAYQPSTNTEALENGKPHPKRKKYLIGTNVDMYSGVNSYISSQAPLGAVRPSTYLEALQTGKRDKKSWYQYIFSGEPHKTRTDHREGETGWEACARCLEDRRTADQSTCRFVVIGCAVGRVLRTPPSFKRSRGV